jgi:hypothetical protein
MSGITRYLLRPTLGVMLVMVGPVWFAAWTPTRVSWALGPSMLFHLKDG